MFGPAQKEPLAQHWQESTPFLTEGTLVSSGLSFYLKRKRLFWSRAERKDGRGLHDTGAAAALQRHELTHLARLGAADLVGLPHRSQIPPPVPPQCGDRQRAGVRDTHPRAPRPHSHAAHAHGRACAWVQLLGRTVVDAAPRVAMPRKVFMGFRVSVYGCSPWLRPAPARVAGCAAADFAHDRNRARHALRRNVDAMANQHAAAAAARPPHLMRHRRHSAAGVLLMLLWLLNEC
jgi:hypothetical protein